MLDRGSSRLSRLQAHAAAVLLLCCAAGCSPIGPAPTQPPPTASPDPTTTGVGSDAPFIVALSAPDGFTLVDEAGSGGWRVGLTSPDCSLAWRGTAADESAAADERHRSLEALDLLRGSAETEHAGPIKDVLLATGEPVGQQEIVGVNFVSQDWQLSGSSSHVRGGVRVILAPTYDGGWRSQTLELLLTCDPRSEAVAATWEIVVPHLRAYLWAGQQETLGVWSGT